MPTKYGSTTMGRDVDTKWVQWLARRKNQGASPPSSTSVPPTTTLHDSGPLHSCSTATSYFALLSATQDQHQPRRQGRPQTPSPSMDSSWVTWLFDRGRGSKRPTGANANAEVDSQTEQILTEPQSMHTAPAFVSSLDSLHFPLNALMDPGDLPAVSNEPLGDLDVNLDLDLDLDFAGQDAELLNWLDGEYSFAVETPAKSGKRGLDSPRDLSACKKQMVDCSSVLAKGDSTPNSPQTGLHK
ncbi:hypothetical protein PENANT_c008G07177 [Penicillium antarcticum]|uniref:Uncharacterized protein n=1 Tax=Penicillium antarcticum TaxID=416450 RepID=A0A1V6QA17_9EURO|nr:uncharacterized protein N7508_007088 [Penicillium antarcticum]KAJ5302225.1 hypothetical protein N7508_007088 [Penicillium antarcticum]OQD86080.1 hypothetical protein PENANT_c008G07177 [Penicillium antarcticum]